jgi:hypothetical protein
VDQKTACGYPSFYVLYLQGSQHLQSHQNALACSSEVSPWCAILIHMHYKGLVSLEAHFATRELLEEKEIQTHTRTNFLQEPCNNTQRTRLQIRLWEREHKWHPGPHNWWTSNK